MKKSDAATIAGGLNTEVEYASRNYHVQTQSSLRDAPIIESMVFQGGQTLVRITASYDEVATTLGFNGADARHLLELQHADLIRKIRHGMLADDDEPEAPRLIDADGMIVDPREIQDAGVQELLRELGAAVDEVEPPRQTPAVPERVAAPIRRSPWPRWAICIRLPF